MTDNTELKPCPIEAMEKKLGFYISESDIEAAFKGTSFGAKPKFVLAETLSGLNADYGTSFTARVCCRELKLVGKNDKLTKKGRRFLHHHTRATPSQQPLNDAELVKEALGDEIEQAFDDLNDVDVTLRHFAYKAAEVAMRVLKPHLGGGCYDIERVKKLLKETLVTLNHAEKFISSRQVMHEHGIKLYMQTIIDLEVEGVLLMTDEEITKEAGGEEKLKEQADKMRAKFLPQPPSEVS